MSGVTNKKLGIKDFYKDQTIFLTGATGFIGKLFIERILYSCDVAKIYVLIRPKVELSVKERLHKLLWSQVFDKVREKNPQALEKVIPIEGDLGDANFYMSPDDKKLLEESVTILVHSAALVKFDSSLKDAVLNNIRGTLHVLQFSKNIRNLKVLTYVSTAYSNCNRNVIDERCYEPKGPKYFWEILIKAAEFADKTNDTFQLDIITERLIQGFPNTYTFSKHYAESLVKQYSSELPIAIFRPSIVAFVYKHPLPGWVDNLNGPAGINIGIQTGVIKFLLGKKKSVQDYIAADYVTNSLVAVLWDYVQKKNGNGNCEVYNAVAGEQSHMIEKASKRFAQESYKIPAEKMLWTPSVTVLDSNIIYSFIMFMHFIISLMLDLLLKMAGYKFSLVRLYRKIVRANILLYFFASTTIDIRNDKVREIFKSMSSPEQEEFYFNMKDAHDYFDDIIQVGLLGNKKYILNEDISEEALDNARRKAKIFYALDIVFKIIMAWWMTQFVLKMFYYQI